MLGFLFSLGCLGVSGGWCTSLSYTDSHTCRTNSLLSGIAVHLIYCRHRVASSDTMFRIRGLSMSQLGRSDRVRVISSDSFIAHKSYIIHLYKSWMSWITLQSLQYYCAYLVDRRVQFPSATVTTTTTDNCRIVLYSGYLY